MAEGKGFNLPKKHRNLCMYQIKLKICYNVNAKNSLKWLIIAHNTK